MIGVLLTFAPMAFCCCETEHEFSASVASFTFVLDSPGRGDVSSLFFYLLSVSADLFFSSSFS